MQVNESIERNISWESNLMNIMMAYFANLAGISGGLERTLCQLPNALNARGHNVLVVVYNDIDAPSFFEFFCSGNRFKYPASFE